MNYRIPNREKEKRRQESERGSRREGETEAERVSAAIGKRNGGDEQRPSDDEGVHQEPL